jgi:hypothetical protein
MNVRILFRCMVLLGALASLTLALGACHTSPRRTWNKAVHNR